jgi:hypothetical protein
MASWRSAALAAAVALAAFFWPAQAPRSDSDYAEVTVRNFPAVQAVSGTVAVSNLPPATAFVRREGIVVPPFSRSELYDAVQAEALDAGGFSRMVLSLQGEIRDAQPRPGVVAAVLVPDEEPILMALRDARKVEFPVEVAAPLDTAGTLYFASEPVEASVAFPRYRIYFYNTTGKGAGVNLYVHLFR